MNHSFIPPTDTYTIDVSLNKDLTTSDLAKAGKLTGRLVKNYLVTPKQAILIASIACAIFATVAAFTLPSIFIVLSLSFSVVGFIYYFKGPDIYSKRARQKMADGLSQMPPLELIQNAQSLKDMFDYDLARYKEWENRAKYYVMLARLQSLFISIIKRRLEFEYKTLQTKKEIERQIDLHYQMVISENRTCLQEAKNELHKLEEQAQEQDKPVIALQMQIQQIRDLFSNQLVKDATNASCPSSEDSQMVDRRILELPSLERQVDEAKKTLEKPQSEIEAQERKIEHYEGMLREIDKNKQESVETLEKWKVEQLKVILAATEQAFKTLEDQFKAVVASLQDYQLEVIVQ